MKKMMFNISILVCFLMLSNPFMTFAEEKNQNLLTMEELSIKVMPEFTYHPNDEIKQHPPLLIGYQGTLRNQSGEALKGRIEIPLPMGEKNFRIGYVADYSSDLSKVYEIEYIIDQEKGAISWTTSEEIQENDVYKFVIEYFTDTINVDKEKKSVSYQFQSFTDIGLVNVSFMEPLKAEKVVLNPATEKNSSHAEEKGVHSYFFQGIKVGDKKSFALSYERNENATTIEMMDKAKQQPNEKKPIEKYPAMLSMASVSGAGVLAAGAFIYIFKRNRSKK